MTRLSNGQLVNRRYQILSFLGQGSFAQVYLASDLSWRGNLVALKEIPTGHFSHKEYLNFNARFLQEAVFLMRLQHPGLPRVVEFFAEGSNYYLAMEWAAGHTLEQEVLQRSQIPVAEVLDWGLQIAHILAYLHSQEPYPILMGDLKPANAVLDYQGKVRVIDFGVACHASPQQWREYALVSPGFSPPEQYQAGRLNQGSDLYAWGATLWWCLKPGNLRRFRFRFPPLSQLRPDVPPSLDRLLQDCLEVNPNHRFQSTTRVIEVLQDAQRELGQYQEPTPSQILSALYRDRKKKFDF